MGFGTAWARTLAAAGIASVLAYGVALAWAFESQSYNVWGSLLITPLLGAVNAILIWQAGKREPDPWIARLFLAGFAAKMLGSFARYFMVFVLYGGVSDANRYNLYATQQHELWRQGEFVWEVAGKTGTQNLELVTTAVYTIIGPAPLAGFLVFASFAFWGVYFLYRAFALASPEGDHRLYAALLFLMPSILFWPSSIGKEAWLLLWLGVGAYGVARYFGQHRRAWSLMLLGAVGTAMIRPHLTVLLAAGVLVAQALRPVGPQAVGTLRKLLGLAAFLVAVTVLATQSAEFLGIEDLSPDTVAGTIEWASDQTDQGGSNFTPLPLTHPLGIPMAIVTMLFRPFAWEASGAPMLLQAFEGMFLLALCWWRRASLRQLLPTMRENPYVTFAVVYALGFTVAFAGFSNFGILARQRTLMLPFVLLLFALPARRRDEARADAGPALVASEGAS